LRMIHIDPASLNENTIRRSVQIYSPIDGYVSAVHVNIGKYVNPSDVLFELVNPNDLHLTLKVFEKDLPRIRKGQRVKVNLVNHPEKAFEAEVSLVSKSLDNDRSAEVHCHLLNATDELLPGMFATGEIAVEKKQAVTVPEEAVVRWGDAQYVFLQKGKGVFEMSGVNVGATVNGKMEIDSAKADLLNQTIINKNAYAALMKLQNKAE
jgi:membrane fusion protein, heavy metal efflux system